MVENSFFSGEVLMMRMSPNVINEFNHEMYINSATGIAPTRGMILPFTPLAMSFDEVSYFVDMPPVSLICAGYTYFIV